MILWIRITQIAINTSAPRHTAIAPASTLKFSNFMVMVAPNRYYSALLKHFPKIRQRHLQPFFESHLGLPLQHAFRLANVRATPLRIVLRQRLKDDRRRIVEMFTDALGKF